MQKFISYAMDSILADGFPELGGLETESSATQTEQNYGALARK